MPTGKAVLRHSYGTATAQPSQTGGETGVLLGSSVLFTERLCHKIKRDGWLKSQDQLRFEDIALQLFGCPEKSVLIHPLTTPYSGPSYVGTIIGGTRQPF